MASIRIHQDQENQRPEAKTMHAVGGNNGVQNQKRAVLGDLNTNRSERNLQPFKAKQPLGQSKLSNITNCQNKENWSTQYREKENNLKNIVNPVIPVNQFEAFKVYEDEDKAAEERREIDAKLKHLRKNRPSVYRGDEKTFYTKKQVAELQAKGLLPHMNPAPESPISLERDENEYPEHQSSSSDDALFNMEEYSLDIYKYLRQHELNNRAKPGYMKKQPDVTTSMRRILVDWLVEVGEEYKLHTETLYLTVNYIDRFLSYMSVVRAKLQLVGTAAMFLASKYEEIYPPDIGEYVYITDDTYTKRQMIRMEQLIVKVLGFDLSVPTPLSLLTAMCCLNPVADKTKFLAMFICELSILDCETFLEFLPSQIAASALAIAQFTLDLELWNDSFVTNTGYTLRQLRPCIQFLTGMFKEAPTNPQHAIPDKYKAQKYLHVSQIQAKSEDFPFPESDESVNTSECMMDLSSMSCS